MGKRKTLREQLLECKKEIENYKDQYLRALAELDNYKKRARNEKEEIVKRANERLMLELIPVLDNFDRGMGAAKNSENFDNFYKGIELIYKGFKEVVEKEGLISFTAIGNKFDPSKHEAVSLVESDEHAPDTVLDEIYKGYMLNGKLIRPAKVIVSKGGKHARKGKNNRH
jgi:molecular chaperone GrpE